MKKTIAIILSITLLMSLCFAKSDKKKEKTEEVELPKTEVIEGDAFEYPEEEEVKQDTKTPRKKKVKRYKTNISVSYANATTNKAYPNTTITQTSKANVVRLNFSNVGFINMNGTINVVLPYKDNVGYSNGEMGKIKGKQPYGINIIAAPGINLPLTNNIKAYAEIGLKISADIVNTQTTQELRKDLMVGLGIGGGFGFKFFEDKKINAVIGCDIYTDFYKAGTVINTNLPSANITYSPFVGIGFTF